jgi:aminoglycoside phosphotransferase
MNIPIEIESLIKNLSYKEDNIGRSEDKVLIFEDKYILKISKDSKRLLREKERIDWLSDKIPGSKSICYIENDNKYYYLRTFINGDSLISERFIKNPILLIEVLCNIIKILRTLDNKNCPYFSTDNKGNDFIHGDLCLPNIYVNSNNEFIGFIDLDNSGIGDKWYDYSWLLWSLSYNLGTDKYNEILLNKINIKMDYEKYNLYIPKEYR